MTRTLPAFAAALLLAAPASAQTLGDEAAQIATLQQVLEIAGQRNARLAEVIAPNGIQTSGMTSDGWVTVEMQDGSTRQERLEFIGAIDIEACVWGADFDGLDDLPRGVSQNLKDRLTAENWGPDMTGTSTALSDAECRARASFAVLEEGCLTVFPATLSVVVELHFAIYLPEVCQ